MINKSTLNFLKELAINNNRDWFNSHKEDYLIAQQNIIVFVDQLIKLMNGHDQIENTSGKKSLFRIYKDVRFSKDKSPYNPWFAFGLQRATKLRRGGYYMQIKPDSTFLACGFFAPNVTDLSRIRNDIAVNYKLWHKILNSSGIQNNFGNLSGEQVKTAPKGFSSLQPGIELLRHKQFILRSTFTDKEVLSDQFANKVNLKFKAIRPYFNYMSDILTSDLNGVSIF